MKNIFNKTKLDNLKNGFFQMLTKRRKLLLFLVLVLVLAYSGYLWYAAVYNYSWNENKKQEYIKSKTNEEIFFNRTKFEEVISKTEKRKAEYQNTAEVPRDIFGIE